MTAEQEIYSENLFRGNTWWKNEQKSVRKLRYKGKIGKMLHTET